MKYTIGKKSRLYTGKTTGRSKYDTFEDAKAAAEAQTNPVGFDVYLIDNDTLIQLDENGKRL